MAEYFQLLRRDLTTSLPAPQWPANTRLDHYRDELAPAIHAVLRMTQEPVSYTHLRAHET